MEHYKNLSLENIVEVVDGVTYVEEWRDIPNYEGIYKISNFGRVKKLRKLKYISPIILKARFTPTGYQILNIYKNGIVENFRLHRILAEIFIPNPLNKPQLNHINGIKHDNRIINLEWCTISENVQHSYDMGLNKRRFSSENKRSRRVIQMSLSGENIREWNSIRDAAIGIKFYASGIGVACRGKAKTANGFKWKFA